ncbi:MAG: T9SS type A sorting domain-containing protein, partial [Crocinitomicaceae bacterium]|nr:T9SS type A sorting domain-containing protein [Crocinitomicaceae bacterium]
PAFGWTIDANSDGWWSSNGISSTSGGGYAELSNGAANATPPTQALDVLYTMTSIILDIPNLPDNTGNTDQVTLSYEEFGARYNDLQEVQISTDGLAWTTIRDNSDIYGVLSIGGGSGYPNPANVSINLSPYITGAASQVQIRFSWTTNFPSLSTNPNVWVTYGWYIDDLKITTNPDNDVESTDPYWGTAFLNYSQIPTTQVAPIDFVTEPFNGGLNPQTNVELNVDFNSGAWTGVSQSVTIPVGGYDSLIVSTQYTPAAVVGSHSFTWEITQDEIDDVPSNNVIQGDDFDVTEYIYAQDDDLIDGFRGNSGEAYEVGNFFDIWADQTVYYVDVKLHNTTEIGSTVYAKIYSFDGTQATFADALNFVQQSGYHTVTSSDVSGVLSLPLLFPTPLTVAQTTYFVVLATDGDGGTTDDVVCATSGTSPNLFSYVYADNTWYLQPATPIVRLNFDGSDWGLNENGENISAVNIFPNPANDVVNVSYNVINASDVTVEIMDMTGSVVETVSNESNVQGVQNVSVNTSNFASGVYFVNIATSEGIVKNKFVKN